MSALDTMKATSEAYLLPSLNVTYENTYPKIINQYLIGNLLGSGMKIDEMSILSNYRFIWKGESLLGYFFGRKIGSQNILLEKFKQKNAFCFTN